MKGVAGVFLEVGLQVVYLLLYFFYLVLLGRFVLSTVLGVGRRWQPSRGASASMEVVWSVTDPPIKALRRVFPFLRIGTVGLDLAPLVLLLILFVLMEFVVKNLISLVYH